MSPAVAQALQRRGMGAGTPQINQTSPDARQANPVSQPTNPSDVQSIGQVPQVGNQEFTPSTQDDLIVSALIEQLGRNNKLQKEQVAMGGGVMPTQMNVPMVGGGTSKSPKQQQSSYPY